MKLLYKVKKKTQQMFPAANPKPYKLRAALSSQETVVRSGAGEKNASGTIYQTR